MELDKKAIRALSSDTRVDILKSLAKRRKTPAELSRELGLAGSTVVEHLKKLENSGLVRKERTHRKWIYYELTSKGRNLVKPTFPVQFAIMLSVGILFAFFGVYNFYTGLIIDARQMISEAGVKTMTGDAEAAPALLTGGTETSLAASVANFVIDWMWAITLIIGLVLIYYAMVNLWSKLR